MKIRGAELRLFAVEAWPQPEDDWHVDCEDDTVDFDYLDDDRIFDTNELGPILYQGRGEDPTGGVGYDMAALIRRWRKARSQEVLTVVVPKERADEFRAALASYGAKVA